MDQFRRATVSFPIFATIPAVEVDAAVLEEMGESGGVDLDKKSFQRICST